MFFHRTPKIVQWLYPNLIWSVSNADKVIYLTFDDGPVPHLTPFVLDELKKYQAKATFFCVGGNLVKNRAIAERSLAEGHILANHTFNHIQGWGTEDKTYLENVKQCEEQLSDLDASSHYFRPPYGKIKRSQIQLIKPKYKIIMWDVLSGDYSNKISKQQCLHQTIKATQSGSIVLFHDNIKAADNLYFTLPRYLEHFSNLGYRFKAL